MSSSVVLKIALGVVCLNSFFAFILILRAVLLPLLEEHPCFDSHDSSGGNDKSVPDVNVPQAVERFRNGLKFKTICWNSGNYDKNELDSIIAFIIKNYPVIHMSSLVNMEVVANYSLLYKVVGQNQSISPYLVLAHLDVVPTENQHWKHSPFAAEVEDGFIYARGTLDDKHNLFAILESLELLLRSGYKPERTFYISFGHDEECLGSDGAAAVERILKERKVHFEFVLDEGTMIMENIYPSVDKPVAHIAVAEKGQLSIQLSVNHTGGHSSMPEKENSIGILSKAVINLNADAHPSMLGFGIEKYMLETISYHTSWPLTVVFRNIWFFRPLISWVMSMEASANAIIRTSTAVTMFNSGGKENVIPAYVEAVVNHRIHSSQTVDEVLEYDRKLINDDRVKLKVLRSFNPVRQSCFLPSCSGYQVIKETIRKLWKDTIVVPAALSANTDSRYFTDLADNIYRFTPVVLKPQDLSRIHGQDERISVDAYVSMIHFYYNLYLTVDKYHLHPRSDARQDL